MDNMINDEFKDCYVKYNKKENLIIIGNDLIEKQVAIINNCITTLSIVDKSNKNSWSTDKEEKIYLQSVPFLTDNNVAVNFSYNSCTKKDTYIQNDFFKVVVTLSDKNTTVWYECSLFPNSPFITTQVFVQSTISGEKVNGYTKAEINFNGVEGNYVNTVENQVICDNNVIECVGLGGKHLEVEVLTLYDKTDINDYLLEQNNYPLYFRGTKKLNGNIFIFNEYLEDNGLMLIKNSPTASSELSRCGFDARVLGNNAVEIIGTGMNFNDVPLVRTPYYSCTVGVGDTSSIKVLYKRYYSEISTGDRLKDLFIMSNTWGDRSQDKAICEEFILKEIDMARELGVDIVQIDDGWEEGVTANSLRKKGGVWEGFYASDENFWRVNRERFPSGLQSIVDYAKQYNIEIGLWFGPDSSNDFANYNRDIDTIFNLYKTYGIGHYKLDGIKIRNKTCEINFINFMDTLTQMSKGDITFNLDVTAEDRFGYLYEKQFGTLFMENRYTDWGNYYPHNTLKNIWCLSQVIPTRHIQVELLNNKRNTDKYEGDSLAPILYTMDYIFATTMMSNPLVWMEMSSLIKEDIQALKDIILVYKKHSKNLFNCIVNPIGERPNGISFTGFEAVLDKTFGYLLLFRENTDTDSFDYTIGASNECDLVSFELLYSNAQSDNVVISLQNNVLTAKFKNPRTFAFIKYSR